MSGVDGLQGGLILTGRNRSTVTRFCLTATLPNANLTCIVRGSKQDLLWWGPCETRKDPAHCNVSVEFLLWRQNKRQPTKCPSVQPRYDSLAVTAGRIVQLSLTEGHNGFLKVNYVTFLWNELPTSSVGAVVSVTFVHIADRAWSRLATGRAAI